MYKGMEKVQIAQDIVRVPDVVNRVINIRNP